MSPRLVLGQDLGQLALGRLARDGLGLHALVAERLGDVVGVAHAGRVDHTGHAVEPRLVEAGDRHVEGQLVQQLGQQLLVELDVHVAAAQRDLGDGPHARAGRDADGAQRRDHAAAGRLREVEARRLCREEVCDVPGDERARRGHADEDGPGPLADRGRRLLAQRGVRLVADDDRVSGRDPARVAHEPLVGLDRDGTDDVLAVAVVLEQGRALAVGVAARAQLAEELVDQVATVGEDQDAAGSRGLDEAHGGDGLAGPGGVLEPEALGGVGVVGRLAHLHVLVDIVDERLVVPVRRLLDLLGAGVVLLLVELDEVLVVLVLLVLVLFLLDREDRGRGRCGGRPVALRLGEQRGERAGEGVDLMRVEQGPVRQVRLVLGEQPLEPEQQRVVAAPLRRRRLRPGLDLGQRRVQSLAPAAPRGERVGDVLAGVHEGFARELLSALHLRWCGYGLSGHGRGSSHRRASS